jgi:hypothetical protein
MSIQRQRRYVSKRSGAFPERIDIQVDGLVKFKSAAKVYVREKFTEICAGCTLIAKRTQISRYAHRTDCC